MSLTPPAPPVDPGADRGAQVLHPGQREDPGLGRAPRPRGRGWRAGRRCRRPRRRARPATLGEASISAARVASDPGVGCPRLVVPARATVRTRLPSEGHQLLGTGTEEGAVAGREREHATAGVAIGETAQTRRRRRPVHDRGPWPPRPSRARPGRSRRTASATSASYAGSSAEASPRPTSSAAGGVAGAGTASSSRRSRAATAAASSSPGATDPAASIHAPSGRSITVSSGTTHRPSGNPVQPGARVSGAGLEGESSDQYRSRSVAGTRGAGPGPAAWPAPPMRPRTARRRPSR